MKIAVIVGGRWFAVDYARELERRGELAAYVTSYPLMHREGISLRRLRWNPLLDARRRLETRRGAGSGDDVTIRFNERFARWAATRSLGDADVVQAWTGYALESLQRARREGRLAVAFRASSHILAQARTLAEEFERFGLCAAPIDPRMVERELAEYDAAHRINVVSTFAGETFVREGVARDRLVVTPMAAAESFAGAERRAPDDGAPLRVLFLGLVSLRKGPQYLLDAARRLGGAIQLSIVGGVTPDGQVVLDRMARDGEYRGKVPRSELARVFGEHDVMVFPSLEEGLAASIPEAMSAGLPVIATPESGAGDVIDDGVSGLIVPARDVDALVAAIAALAADRERCRAMGRAAAGALRDRLTFARVVDGMTAQYQAALDQMGARTASVG